MSERTAGDPRTPPWGSESERSRPVEEPWTEHPARAWFDQYGFWAIFAAGFTPIPYKVFTIAAGAAQMPLLPFVIGSTIGRGARFLLVSALVRWGGPMIEQRLRRYVDAIGWATLALLVVGYLLWRVLG